MENYQQAFAEMDADAQNAKAMNEAMKMRQMEGIMGEKASIAAPAGTEAVEVPGQDVTGSVNQEMV